MGDERKSPWQGSIIDPQETGSYAGRGLATKITRGEPQSMAQPEAGSNGRHLFRIGDVQSRRMVVGKLSIPCCWCS